MVEINKNDLSIAVTRGDIATIQFDAENDGEQYTFQVGDIVRITVYGKKDVENVVLQKEYMIEEASDVATIILTAEDTTIGDPISKPVQYWYEVELNPDTNPQTLIGYDEDGAKLFVLYPEGSTVEVSPPITPEDIPFVDDELDGTSERPVQNKVISAHIFTLEDSVEKAHSDIATVSADSMRRYDKVNSLAHQNSARLDVVTSLPNGSTTGDAEIADIRVDAHGKTWSTAGNAVRGFSSMLDSRLSNVAVYNGQNLITRISGGCKGANGTFYGGGTEIGQKYVNAEFDVSVDDSVIIDTYCGGDVPYVLFLDSGGRVIKTLPTSGGSDGKYPDGYTDATKPIVIPANVAKLCVNAYKVYTPRVRNAEKTEVDFTSISEFTNNILGSFDLKYEPYGENLCDQSTIKNGTYIDQYGYYRTTTATRFKTAEAPVEGGKAVSIVGSFALNYYGYAILDKYGNIISTGTVEDGTAGDGTVTSGVNFAKNIILPVNAGKIIVADCNDDGRIPAVYALKLSL